MEKYVEQLQNRGFDGSGPVYKSQGPASGASSPSSGADVGNTDGIATNDGVSLPKLYEYDITLSGLTNTAPQGIISDISSENIANVTTSAKGDQTERGNMRFSAMISHLGENTNIYEFSVSTSGVLTTDTANVGTTHGNSPVYRVKYETKPWYRVSSTSVVEGAEAVQRAVSDALGSNRTETRMVFHTATENKYKQEGDELEASGSPTKNVVAIPLTGSRKELTADALDTPANLKSNNVDAAGVASTAAAGDSSTS